MKKKKKIHKYKDWILDSQEECDFCFYLQELQDNGYVSYFYRAKSLVISEPLKVKYTEQLKTKTKVKEQTIMQGSSYTYDFVIVWTDLGVKYFCNTFKEKWIKPFICTELSNTSHIEIKNTFDYQNMTRLATLNIKFIWSKYNIFVQLVKLNTLFAETFTPKAILLTKTGKTRVFKWKIVSLQDYIKLQDKN